MKKLVISLALLTAVAAMHAREKKEVIKDVRSHIKHSTQVDNLKLSPGAKAAEKKHIVVKGQELHDEMAQSGDGHEDRMSVVKKHVREHAESLSSPHHSKKRVITQD